MQGREGGVVGANPSMSTTTVRRTPATLSPPSPLSHSRSWAQLLVKEGIIEKFVPIDFSDVETVFDRCLKVVRVVRVVQVVQVEPDSPLLDPEGMRAGGL